MCSEYYDLDKPKAQKEVLDFYRSYLLGAKGPILEPMCGTGNFFIPFTQEGLEIEGYDASEEMLSILKRKAHEKGLNISAWKQFTQEMHESNDYSLISIPLRSLGLVTNSYQLEVTLNNFFASLAPDGKLVFEASKPRDYFENRHWSGNIRYRDKNDFIMLSTLFLPLDNNI